MTGFQYFDCKRLSDYCKAIECLVPKFPIGEIKPIPDPSEATGVFQPREDPARAPTCARTHCTVRSSPRNTALRNASSASVSRAPHSTAQTNLHSPPYDHHTHRHHHHLFRPRHGATTPRARKWPRLASRRSSSYQAQLAAPLPVSTC